MIPYQAALIAWIPISCLIMADRNNARGFALAYLLGLALLPAGRDISIPVLPDLNKDVVTGFGVLLGTIFFHPRLFYRFQLYLTDFLLLGLLQITAITSLINGYGPYDAVSQMLTLGSTFLLPIFLARLHLGTMQSIRTFLLVLIFTAIVCAPFALLEFRISPQIHTWTYGYFQHVFQQHFRGGFWRPILYFSHALALGRFFAFAAFLALLPMRKDLVALFGPIGNVLFLAPLAGLIASQSFGPVMLFGLLCCCYYLFRYLPSAGYVIPALATLWFVLVMVGYNPGYKVVNRVDDVNAERAASLQYRLDALEEYRSVIINRPWFGHGTWGSSRVEGRATDSQALISFLVRGFFGSAVYFGWWFVALHIALRTVARTRGTIFSTRVAGIAALLSIGLGVIAIDYALDLYVLLLVSGLFPIYAWLRANPEMAELKPAVRSRAAAA